MLTCLEVRASGGARCGACAMCFGEEKLRADKAEADLGRTQIINMAMADAVIEADKATLQARAERDDLRALLDAHPRAAKLMRKAMPFFVVAAVEPYAVAVVALIKNIEDGKGTWTDADEKWAVDTLNAHRGQQIDNVPKLPAHTARSYRQLEADLENARDEIRALRKR